MVVGGLPFVGAAPVAEGGGVLVPYAGGVWAGRPTGVDDVSVDADHADRLRGYAAEGWTILGVGWLPGGDSAVLDVTHGQIGVPMEGEVCTHAAGPPRCWCRKPLPGLGVALFRRHGLRPASCLYLGHGSADERFAAQLGVPYVDVGGA